MIPSPGGKIVRTAARRCRWVILIILLNTLLFCRARCGHDIYPTGSRSAGMAQVGVMYPDLWSVHHNQAGLAMLTGPLLGIHHENKFLVPEFSLHALAFALPVKPGTLGFTMSYFGYSKYNESRIGLSFGKLLAENFAAGIQMNYMNIFIGEGYGNQGNLSVEFGILASPAENLFIGAHAFNPLQAGIRAYPGEQIPTIFRVGLGYLVQGKLLAAAEIEKCLKNPPNYRAGMEYTLENLFLRAGISSSPLTRSFGLGYNMKNVRGDVAFTHHQVLGFTPHFSLQVAF